ncbi:MAG: dimethylsulfonioproprionate lyase family protein [Pseudomonadota bacterium]
MSDPSFRRLFDCLASLYETEAGRRPEASAAMRFWAERLAAAKPQPGPQMTASDVPALRYLDEALAAMRQGPFTAIAAALKETAERLPWIQNPNYTAANIGAGYLDAYSYTQIMGAEGLVQDPDLLIGVMIIGPGQVYPAHAHAPLEAYHLLAGPSLWWKEGEDWQLCQPGAFIYHRPWQAHAMRSGRTPLLALGSWYGDTTRGGALTRGVKTPAPPEW